MFFRLVATLVIALSPLGGACCAGCKKIVSGFHFIAAAWRNLVAIVPATRQCGAAFIDGYMSVIQISTVVKSNLLSILMPAKVVIFF